LPTNIWNVSTGYNNIKLAKIADISDLSDEAGVKRNVEMCVSTKYLKILENI